MFEAMECRYTRSGYYMSLLFLKDWLKPDLLASASASPTSLDRSCSSTGDELNVSVRQTSFNELAFPKSSNYGSTKKAKNKKNVGVECRMK